MKPLVFGLLAAMALAVLGIVLLHDDDEAGGALISLLAAFVALDLMALVFVGVAGLWNVGRRTWRRPIRAVLLTAYLGTTVLGYLHAGSMYAPRNGRVRRDGRVSRPLRKLHPTGRALPVARGVGRLRPPQLGRRHPPRPVEA